MKIRNVIDRNNLPRKLPWQGTLIIILALDHWNASEWIWGALGLIIVIAWISYLYNLGTYEQIEHDVFNNDEDHSTKPTGAPEKPKWQQRFEEMQNKQNKS